MLPAFWEIQMSQKYLAVAIIDLNGYPNSIQTSTCDIMEIFNKANWE